MYVASLGQRGAQLQRFTTFSDTWRRCEIESVKIPVFPSQFLGPWGAIHRPRSCAPARGGAWLPLQPISPLHHHTQEQQGLYQEEFDGIFWSMI